MKVVEKMTCEILKLNAADQMLTWLSSLCGCDMCGCNFARHLASNEMIVPQREKTLAKHLVGVMYSLNM